MSNHDLEDLRAEVLDAVRQLFDSQTSQLASGKNFDPQRLLLTIDLITKLLPQTTAEPAPAAYTGAREKLARLIGDAPAPPTRETELAAENERLRAENAELRERASAPAPVKAPPEPKKASPPSKSAPEKWKAPESWTKAEQLRTDPEPWREWSDLSMRRIRHSDWGPI